MTEEIYSYSSLGTGIACAVMVAVTVALFFVLKIPKVISDLTGRTARRAIEDIRRQNEESGDKSHRSSYVNLHRGKLTDKISPSRRIQNPTSGKMKGNTGKIKGNTGRMPGISGQMPIRQDAAPRQVFQGEATTILEDMNATTVLPESNATTVLPESNATTVLPENNLTTVLPESNATTLLPENNAADTMSEMDVDSIFLKDPVTPAPQPAAMPAPTEETTVLSSNETSVLYTPQPAQVIRNAAAFAVVQEITFVHTAEVIPEEGIYGR